MKLPQGVSLRNILTRLPFEYLKDRFLHPFIYLESMRGPPFGRNLPVQAIIGSSPNPEVRMLIDKFSSLFAIFCYIGETFKWFKGGCSNYTIHEYSPHLNWERSRQLCKKTGLGDLVSIESYDEWIFLKNTILKLTIADEYVIGLRRDERYRQWRWLSNKNSSQKDLPWAKGEPNGDGNCATMYKNYLRDYGEYNDVDCIRSQRSGYICEFPVDGCNQQGKSWTFHTHVYFKRLFSTPLFNHITCLWLDAPFFHKQWTDFPLEFVPRVSLDYEFLIVLALTSQGKKMYVHWNPT